MGRDSTDSAAASAAGVVRAQRSERGLLRERHRVVDPGADAEPGQLVPNAVAASRIHAHDHEVVHRPVGPGHEGCPEPVPVPTGQLTSPVGPPGEVWELGVEECSLDAVEAGAPADLEVLVLVRPTVIPEPADVGQKLRVGGDDRAAVAQRSQVLAGVEREAGRMTGGAHELTAVRGQMRLSGVLDHDQATLPPRPDVLRRDRVAVEVNRHHCPGSGGPNLRDVGGPEQQGVRCDVGDDRGGAGVNHRLSGRHERERRDHHLVPRSHAEHPERQGERVGPGAARSCSGSAVSLGERILERGDAGADERARSRRRSRRRRRAPPGSSRAGGSGRGVGSSRHDGHGSASDASRSVDGRQDLHHVGRRGGRR